MKTFLVITVLVLILLLQFIAYVNLSGEQIILKNGLADLEHENRQIRQEIEIIKDVIPSFNQVSTLEDLI